MEKLQKIVNLIKKTGDKAIVLDQSGDPAYVMMSLEDYERLILGKSDVRGLTESELLDKINRDIAIWKENQEGDGFPDEIANLPSNPTGYASFDEAFDADLNNFSKEDGEIEEDRYYFEPVE